MSVVCAVVCAGVGMLVAPVPALKVYRPCVSRFWFDMTGSFSCVVVRVWFLTVRLVGFGGLPCILV